jgi:hypothetical protein
MAWSRAITLGWARMDDGALVRHSALLEAALTLAGRYTAFARVEAAHRPDLRGGAITETGDGEHEHLVVTARAAVAQFSAGVMAGREMLGVTWGMGARASLSLLPPALAPLYGERRPLGVAVFASVRPGGGPAPSAHASH